MLSDARNRYSGARKIHDKKEKEKKPTTTKEKPSQNIKALKKIPMNVLM